MSLHIQKEMVERFLDCIKPLVQRLKFDKMDYEASQSNTIRTLAELFKSKTVHSLKIKTHLRSDLLDPIAIINKLTMISRYLIAWIRKFHSFRIQTLNRCLLKLDDTMWKFRTIQHPSSISNEDMC
ncbi:hypothetical protein PRIPAC_73494 [Pristionchus pacificus]|uniref:Uncharacterized protein n=1 Tax=Pristionchus pacificus TaxID=54126 RepID=A0A2A6C0P4_PRIPA|nr:hypothetical protein PRIPAC_73494 [Pristionchus pacificus]|eukprot:PDM71601.1 hypothetical protein PRIPAC_38008 [Pristionchus pacificus]